jgi:hypothetical protein
MVLAPVAAHTQLRQTQHCRVGRAGRLNGRDNAIAIPLPIHGSLIQSSGGEA